MKHFLMNLLLTIANTADNLASKLATNEPEPLLDYEKRGYEPAGIIHYGEWRFGDYYAQATPHGSYHVWHHDEYLGEHHGQRIEIVEHLHAKDFPRTIEGSRATPEHHSVGGMTPHMCVCGKPLSQH